MWNPMVQGSGFRVQGCGDGTPARHILHPTSNIQHSPRRGVSLMEVLISTFVLSIGLMSIAALIPVGRYTIAETSKSDYAAACGRAAMRDIKIQRMLDYRVWNPQPSDPSQPALGPFVLDPIGRAHGMSNMVGSWLPRVTLIYAGNGATNQQAQELANHYFAWHDDLAFAIPKDATLRPTGYFDHYNGNTGALTGNDQNATPNSLLDRPTNNGWYSWLATVVPAQTEAAAAVTLKRTFCVSVAVCFQRSFNTDASAGPLGEQIVQVDSSVLPAPGTIAMGGGALKLTGKVYCRPNDWILMVNNPPSGELQQCHWYRVVSAQPNTEGEAGTDTLMVEGPDWVVTSGTTQVIVVRSVIGVYSTTMQLDTDNGMSNPVWVKW